MASSEVGHANRRGSNDTATADLIGMALLVAAIELELHRARRNGLCVVCGAWWPCTRVRLAENNLATL